ncbi:MULTISPECIES: CNNM domain-containing protein [unclassified Shewanella]|uniref:HlyC/CorC family transporter n=1 Tax=unclassified Shewanella TaxID=196818 RepID=UPI000C81B594|nr:MULTISPECIES: CNNM domain-containing protein [unclassified Shewanella]MDO6617504.1 CNNM domain-containing protein [Shewanella sp. 6_MG-2023]MDO6638765.1 CNNM domain-containing protein [Shewanella sp. 5_MG-2023]MDO6677120.1 CNNM domain-containing protein [Shewanella sp. 4_MG-2023]MDO6773783.1 CNNM domain-containing protein [Shewanella sp. 3_MG-2023]PMG31416.1 magnesium/cobalt efflux protein [Shewanella sp. 10N.286.52.C2]
MDAISTSALLFSLLVLICISAYFSGSETAMMTLNRYRLRHLAASGHKGAIRALKMLERPDRLIGLILIGNNLVNILASAIATIIGMRLFGDMGVAIATGVLTLVVLIFAEVTPKTIAALHPERIAFPSSLLLKALLSILWPLVKVINLITSGFLRVLGIKNVSVNDALSQEELRTVVHEAGALIPQRHQEMLLSILDLEKVTVEDIMIPRSDIYAINVNDEFKLINKQVTQSPHTRVLVYRDNIDDAVGFIHLRDALRLQSKEEFSKSTLLRAVKELYFIPEGTPLTVQLSNFQQNKERFGLVVDEYGDIQGLVTLEDILEEIVGDFTTSMITTASEDIDIQQDGSFIIEASITIRDLNKEMKWDFAIDGPKTLNGLIIEHLEEIPSASTRLKIGRYDIEVLEVSDNMIKTVKVIPDAALTEVEQDD